MPVDHCGPEQIKQLGLDWVGLDWLGFELDWVGVGLDELVNWIGLDWNGLECWLGLIHGRTDGWTDGWNERDRLAGWMAGHT